MNRKLIERIMTTILSVVITVSSINFTLAEDDIEAYSANVIKPGEYLQMGKYYDEPILWRCTAYYKITGYDDNGNPIVDAMEKSTEPKDGYLPLILSDKIICIKSFDAIGENTSSSHGRGTDFDVSIRKIDGSPYWGDSNIRDWLNSDASSGKITWSCGNSPDKSHVKDGFNAYDQEAGFLSNFSSSEKNLIKKVTQKQLLYKREYSLDSNPDGHIYNYIIDNLLQNYSTAYSENTTDKIFLLDVKQIYDIYTDFKNELNNYYLAYPTNAAVENSEYKNKWLNSRYSWYYYLRTPHNNGGIYVRSVWKDGYIKTNFIDGAVAHYFGIRPAFFLNSSAAIFNGGSGTATDPYTLSNQIISKEIHSIEEVYPINEPSVIMKGGTLKRYYKALDEYGKDISNETIYYSVYETLNGTAEIKSVKTNENGIFAIEIKSPSDAEYTVKIYDKNGNINSNVTLPPDFNVNITEKTYTENYSLNTSISAAGGVGYKQEFGPVDVSLLEATLGLEHGSGVNISFNNKEKEKDVTITSSKSNTFNSKLSAGPKAQIKKTFEVSGSGKMTYSTGSTDGYSVTFADFFNKNAPNYNHNGAMAALIVLDGLPQPSLFHYLIKDKLDEELAKESNAEMRSIETDTVQKSMGGSIKVTLGEIAENSPIKPEAVLADKNLETVYKFTKNSPLLNSTDTTIKTSTSVAQKDYKDFLRFSLVSNISDTDQNDVKTKAKFGFDIIDSLIKNDSDIVSTLSTSYKDKNNLNAVVLTTEIMNSDKTENGLIINKNNYQKMEYTLERDNLSNALKNSDILNKISKGERTLIDGTEFDALYESLNTLNDYINVSSYSRDSSIIDADFGLGATAAVFVGEANTKIKASYSKEYKTEDGFANKDNAFVTAQYDENIYNFDTSLSDFWKVVKDGTWEYASDIITSKIEKITDGVKEGYATIKSTAKSGYIKITKVWNKLKNHIIFFSLDSEENSNGNIIEASAVSDVYIVERYDDNQNLIFDFSDDPMELSIDYDNGDNSDLSIYYFDEELNIYVKINSEVDTINKTVTANITKSGQYILGNDTDGPVISNVSVSSDSQTINASITDSLTGVDAKSINISIDSENVLLGDEATEYYNTASGYLSFKLPQPLADGSHNLKIVAQDNSGNTSEYTDVFIIKSSNDFVIGDADGDNVITASDAAFVLQKTLISTFELPIQKKTDDWLKYTDVDADNNITASDAAFILQKTLISTFELPAEKKYN